MLRAGNYVQDYNVAAMHSRVLLAFGTRTLTLADEMHEKIYLRSFTEDSFLVLSICLPIPSLLL